MHILSNCIISPQVKNRAKLISWPQKEKGITMCSEFQELDYIPPTQTGGRWSSLLQGRELWQLLAAVTCTAPRLFHHWPLEVCSSHWGWKEEEEEDLTLLPTLLGKLFWIPASTGEQMSGGAQVSLTFFLIGYFQAFGFFVGLLEVCQTGAEEGVRCRHCLWAEVPREAGLYSPDLGF